MKYQQEQPIMMIALASSIEKNQHKNIYVMWLKWILWEYILIVKRIIFFRKEVWQRLLMSFTDYRIKDLGIIHRITILNKQAIISTIFSQYL